MKAFGHGLPSQKKKKTTSTNFFKSVYRHFRQDEHRHILNNGNILPWKMNQDAINTLKKRGKVESSVLDSQWKCALTNDNGNVNLSLMLLTLPRNLRVMQCEYTVNFTVPVSALFPCTQSHTFAHGKMQTNKIRVGPMTDAFLTSLASAEIRVHIQMKRGAPNASSLYGNGEEKELQFEATRTTRYRKIPTNESTERQLELVIESMYGLYEICDKLQSDNAFLKQQNEEQQDMIEDLQSRMIERHLQAKKSDVDAADSRNMHTIWNRVKAISRDVKSLKNSNKYIALQPVPSELSTTEEISTDAPLSTTDPIYSHSHLPSTQQISGENDDDDDDLDEQHHEEPSADLDDETCCTQHIVEILEQTFCEEQGNECAVKQYQQQIVECLKSQNVNGSVIRNMSEQEDDSFNSEAIARELVQLFTLIKASCDMPDSIEVDHEVEVEVEVVGEADVFSLQ